MIERFARFPAALAERAKSVRLASDIVDGGVPTLLAHPDWERPAPFVLWLHGRTVNKELDPGRYLRWIRAGIGACAIDLPGHGERFEKDAQRTERTLYVVEQAVAEIDAVLGALRDSEHGAAFDFSRVAIGGMSAGGMVTLRRLCDAHAFVCACVESTAGDFSRMPAYEGRYPAEMTRRLDPMQNLEHWRHLPLLALHSDADEWVSVEAIRSFTETLRERAAASGADPDDVRLHTWPETGAPAEHAGFGRMANEAKNLQSEFLTRWLRPEAAPAAGE
ncbi:MAG: hypothetical protein EA379_06915 [Phycisphaerales bacterium]|nr:MAG: hypothetical protein EA379_06915 [Phycisphaerales bacterium]